MAEVQLRGVEKKYPNGTFAVKGVNFHGSDGEFIVLVGPSGCGKSTTLRMIAGLEEITGGEISIGGTVVNDLEPKDRDIAMVFQNYALYPHMTVAQNISFSLRMRKEKKDIIQSKVNEAAEILGITHLLDRKPKDLSGGERQRVAVGRAIVRKPRVFLFDEPLSNLDAALRTQMRAELKRLQRKLGATMIYVTHDQVEAMTMGDKIVVMNKGLVEQFGTPSEIYSNPASVFVARFLGMPPMNIVEGKVSKTASGYTFNAQGVEVSFSGTEVEAASRLKEGPVSLGIRPERIKVRRVDPGYPSSLVPGPGDAPGTPDAPRVSSLPSGTGFAVGKLVLVEPVGSVTHYYMESPNAIGGTLVASGRHGQDAGEHSSALADFELGETVQFEIPSSSIQLFETSTGKKL